ncbi:MAG: class I SAM-dependent methyltransferase [Desulfobacterales bacterium]|nr:class I SAM-dependent methyltransferase [Desulfobacterales bacterium]
MANLLCPVWVGYLLANPLRKWIQNPMKILGPHVDEGMKVLDIGCAMGFFSLPLAQMVGSKGKVFCVDLQEKMFPSLEKRARKAGLSDRIETRLCRRNSLEIDDLKGKIDFGLAFAVIHEVHDPSDFFSQVYHTMKPSGKFLVAEPKLHVSRKAFGKTLSESEQNGFKIISRPRIYSSHAALLAKNGSASELNGGIIHA